MPQPAAATTHHIAGRRCPGLVQGAGAARVSLDASFANVSRLANGRGTEPHYAARVRFES